MPQRVLDISTALRDFLKQTIYILTQPKTTDGEIISDMIKINKEIEIITKSSCLYNLASTFHTTAIKAIIYISF